MRVKIILIAITRIHTLPYNSVKGSYTLKVKRDERVKGQKCADGQKKLKKSVPGDATTPTVST